MEQPNANKFLEEIKYFSSGNLSETVQYLLTNGGSKSFKYASDMITHCIVGESADANVIEEVRDIYEKPVVQSNWISLSTHASKLLPILPFDPKIPAIFKGVVACVSKLSTKDVRKLWALLEIYGGKLKPIMDSTCTHLICGKACGIKYEEALKRGFVVVVTPDWITHCITEKSLVCSEGYHPSLIIDPKEKIQHRSTVESLRNLKPIQEKKEETKLRVEEVKPAESKLNEVKTLSDSSTLVQQTPQPEVFSHPTTTITAPPSTKNMRVASNLPPHLEQQLQQHSMMRNTAPRQQHQGAGAHSGVRMVRSGLGTTWRGTNQQAALQRPVSHPTSGVEQRPHQQTQQGTRMGNTVQQIRGQVNQAAPQGTNSQAFAIHHQQSMQQLPGMVRQVRLVNPSAQAQQQPMPSVNNSENARPNESGLQRGQTGSQNFQQPQNRLPLNQTTHIVKMVVSQHQVDGKSVNHLEQPSGSPNLMNQQQLQFSNIYSQNGQQIQSTVQQPITAQIATHQQHHFQQTTDDNGNFGVSSATQQTRQQQSAENSYSNVQIQNTGFAQHQQRPSTRLPISTNVQQQGNQGPQQTIIRMHMIQRQQSQQIQGPQQQVEYSTQMMTENSTGIGTVGNSNQVQGLINQQTGSLAPNQQQLQAFSAGVRPNIRPTLPVQSVGNRPSVNGNVPTAVQQQPHMQILQQPQMQQQQTQVQQQQSQMQQSSQQPPQQIPQQVRPLTWQQQQMLHMHIQNMSPQARQQLQQLTPQMRYAVLQRILQQQEANMQQSHGQPVGQNPQSQGQPMTQIVSNPGQRLSTQRPHTWQEQQIQQQNQMGPQQQPVRLNGSQNPVNQLNQAQGSKPTQNTSAIQPVHEQQVVSSQLSQVQVHQQHQMQPLISQGQPQSAMVGTVQLSGAVQLSQPQQQQNHEQPTNSVNPKTKTALANLLSTRLQTAPGTTQQPGTPQLIGLSQQPIVSQQPLISQQQTIAIQQPVVGQQPVAPPQTGVPSQPMLNQQHPHILQQHQRRSLQNITNGGSNVGSTILATVNSAASVANQVQQQVKSGMNAVSFPGAPMPVSLGPDTRVSVPGQSVMRREFPIQQQQQLHSHEPGVKLPEHLCLLGCVVLIVDYQRSVSSSELLQWTKLMSSKGAEIETMYNPRITHLLCETSRSAVAQQALRDGKRLVTAFWLNDVVLKQHMFPPSQVLHFPTPYGEAERPCRNMLVSLSGFEGDDRLRIRFMCEAVGLNYTGHFSSQHDVLICRKPEGPKFQKAREWRKPVVTTTWLAQVYFGFLNAINQIHHPKYQQFNSPAYQQDPLKFEMNMAGNFLAAWRVPVRITPESLDKFNKLPAQLRLKRHSCATNVVGNDVGESSATRKKLKIEEEDKEKHERSSSNVDAILEDVIKGGFEKKSKIRVLIRFSGFDATDVSKAAVKLGAGLAVNNREATHLVMPTIMRTPKLLCCLPVVKFIVSPRWIHESAQEGKLLDEEPYLLKDSELERKMNIDVVKLLSFPTRDQLFKGKTFYITPSVVPSRIVLKDVVESSGGKVVTQPISMKAISDMMQKDETAYVVISCATDFHLLIDMAKHKIGIYSSELILSAVLKQEIIREPFRIEL